MSALRFSLVIPAYNEEAYLPRLLDTVDVARAQYANGPDSVEVIVSDNGSTDRTPEIARDRGCKVANVETRRIACVRNGGAALATGEILCFVDADMRIHPDTFNAIDKALETGKVVAGSTGIRLERMSLGLLITLALMKPLLWLARMDSGVIFCRRSDYDAVGGYNEERRVGEDIQFLVELAQLGRSRGQKLCLVKNVKAISSTRKWDEHGEWHFFTVMFHTLYSQFFARERFDAYANRLWYGNQRESGRDE